MCVITPKFKTLWVYKTDFLLFELLFALCEFEFILEKLSETRRMQDSTITSCNRGISTSMHVILIQRSQKN